MTMQSNKINIGCLMMLINIDHILLMRKSKDSNYEPGGYVLPSGKKEFNESVAFAAIREAHEEIGVEIDLSHVELVHTMSRKTTNGEEWIDCFFVAKVWHGIPKIKEPNNFDDYSWYSMDKLPKETAGFIKSAIASYKNGLSYSEFGY